MSESAKLGAKREQSIATLVESGRYRSRSDVLREGVRLVEEREARLGVLDTAIAQGLADADEGRFRPVEEVAERLTAKYRALSESREA